MKHFDQDLTNFFSECFSSAVLSSSVGLTRGNHVSVSGSADRSEEWERLARSGIEADLVVVSPRSGGKNYKQKAGPFY